MKLVVLSFLAATTVLLAACGVIATAPSAPASITAAEAGTGKIVRTIIPGPSLDGDMAGDETPLEALVYLPPSYASDTGRRYPLVVLLHGYWSTPEQWEDDYFSMTKAYAEALAAGDTREMIVVMPTGYDRLAGGFYVNGAASGNWADYIAEDVVAYMDANYRTLTARASRGIAGHSMGGYGAFAVATAKPEVFSALYALSPCCGALIEEFGLDSPAFAAAEEFHSIEDFEASDDFLARVLVAIGAAWAPQPDAPLNSRRPVVNGALDDTVLAMWKARTLSELVISELDDLRGMTAIGLDVGDREDFGHIAGSVPQIAASLQAAGLPVEYETYPGDHISGVGTQMTEDVLPFFSQHLTFE